MRAAIEEDLIDGFYNDPTIAQLLPDMEGRVRSGAIGPFDAAEELLKRYRGKS